jgi:hypothetical protein
MKTTILSMAIAVLLFAACNSGTKTTGNTGTSADTAKTGATEKITATNGSTKPSFTGMPYFPERNRSLSYLDKKKEDSLSQIK